MDNIKMIIAKDGERVIENSSQEEFHKFVIEGMRDKFKDNNVLAIRFVLSFDDDIDFDDESTNWFINPANLEALEYDEDNDIIGGPYSDYICYTSYGPKMDIMFPPELLIMQNQDYSIFEKFCKFKSKLSKEIDFDKLSDDEKLKLFEKS